jgi:aspartate racemase
VRCLESHDWHGVADLMLISADKLKSTGAAFLICPDNTIHQAFPLMIERSPLPWLHIAEVVAEAAKSRGYRQAGLLGTKWLTESDVYPQRLALHGMDCLVSEPEDRLEMSRIIMDELVAGVFKPSSVAAVQQMIVKLMDRGADCVILGCTEIPLIIDGSNSPLPTLDSTRLLARAALKRSTYER